jgi:elongation factor G
MAIAKLVQEDPTLRISTDHETGQTILAGMGELHLDIIVDRLQREFGVGANVGKPQVAYRETVRKKAEGEGRFVRQTGGHGQYGHVKIRIEPITDSNYIFVNGTTGGSVPKEFIGPSEKGIVEAISGQRSHRHRWKRARACFPSASRLQRPCFRRRCSPTLPWAYWARHRRSYR